MISNITIGELSALILGTVALLKGVEWLINPFTKRSREHEQLLKDVADIKEDNRMIMRAVYELVQHEVTGNGVNDMKALMKDISNHLVG